jgi:MoxR-like ATPase
MEIGLVTKLLDEGRNEDLSNYAKGKVKKLMHVTFYLLCKKLIRSEDFCCPSRILDGYIAEQLKSEDKPLQRDSKPGRWFTQEYTEFPRNKSSHFRGEWADIVNRSEENGSYIYKLNPAYVDCISQYFGQEKRLMNDHQNRGGGSDTREDSELKKLGDALFWEPPERMEKAAKLLSDYKKRQLIFYGPPGTGKTYVARALAKHLMGGEEPTFLQFHPSYSYEDFFEGYRPVRSKNRSMPQFKLVSGPLKQIAQKAASEPLKTFVLVIDEINRGNLAKIFGELYFLLEYRDEEIMLQYGGQPFSLPKNLHIIGTMNTADRSISHIDAALRRRFHFFPLFPDEEPIRGLLQRYLAKEHEHKELERIAQIVNLTNEKLGCRHDLIGHSYFMRGDLDESWFRLIWESSIMPLIEDRFIDQEDRVKEFELDTLLKELEGDRVREYA